MKPADFKRRPPGVSGSGISKWRKAIAKGWKPNCGFGLAEIISRRLRTNVEDKARFTAEVMRWLAEDVSETEAGHEQ